MQYNIYSISLEGEEKTFWGIDGHDVRHVARNRWYCWEFEVVKFVGKWIFPKGRTYISVKNLHFDGCATSEHVRCPYSDLLQYFASVYTNKFPLARVVENLSKSRNHIIE